MADGGSARRGAPGCNGFTLLELLIVMVMLASLLAVALPQFSQLFARLRCSFERSDLEQQLLELPQRARQKGRGGVLADAADIASADGADTIPQDGNPHYRDTLRIELPTGWSLQVPKPIYYNFTGACSGGAVVFSFPPVVYTYTLTPPLCRPELTDAG